MSVIFRRAVRGDVKAIVELLRDDDLGQGREEDDLAPYLDAFDAMEAETSNRTIVGDQEGRIVATYQMAVISGLSRRATRRAQIESVRVASDMRGRGIGAMMIADAEARALDAGCTLVQLTMDRSRTESRRFYEAQGFVASHVGFKKAL